ncbi:MAG: OmpH family outer membrane protein [Spirochaetes bacterium]|nr:OmpH family outer membrane protein [Spirochaetota bacterium]
MPYRLRIIALVLSGIGLLSCSLFPGRTRTPEAPPVIRYVNLKFIYDYFINQSNDARELAQRKAAAIEAIRKIEMQMKEPNANMPELMLNHQRQKYTYQVLEKQEEEHKQRISQRIQRALGDLAEDMGADYILNIGDEVIYAKKRYDVTEQVIREVVDLGKRSEPVSR